jgi:hypothetical protein
MESYFAVEQGLQCREAFDGLGWEGFRSRNWHMCELPHVGAAGLAIKPDRGLATPRRYRRHVLRTS